MTFQYQRPIPDSNPLDTSFLNVYQNQRQKEKEKQKLDTEKKKKEQQLKETKERIETLKRDKAFEYKTLGQLKATISSLIAGGAPSNQIDTAIANYNAQRNLVISIDSKLNTAESLKKSIENDISSKYSNSLLTDVSKNVLDKTKSNKNKNKNSIKGATEEEPKNPGQQTFSEYKYNIPMVRSVYFTTRSPQTQTTVRGVSGGGNYSDARTMFSETGVAKGTLQMPRDLAETTAWKNKTGIYKNDSTMYGFKFLYNPTEISMGWGMLEDVDPNVIRTGKTGNLAPVTGVGLATIDFTLLLNRIEDMNYLNENGLIPGEDPSGPYEGVNPIQRVEDLKMIYKKGTMYDLEYLFRTVNGPSAIHSTVLNDLSADWGFLIGSQLELFLGDGLRYMIRLNGINVNHTLFNDRMVPILSQVSISCGRYNDVGLKQNGDDRSR